MPQRGSSAGRRRALGLVMVIVLVAIVAAVWGGYRKVFTPVVNATVVSDRAGLLMLAGGAVTVRGLKVGEVREVRPDGAGAALEIAIDEAEAEHIPAGVTATIGTPTLFGAKYVELQLPARPGGPRIAEGAVIRTDRVVTEANTLLAGLNDLLTTVDVAKVNSALGGLSTGLQGNGDRLGRMVVQTNRYLEKLNPSVPALARDLAVAAPVTETYAAVTPDLADLADDLGVTSTTLADREPALERLLAEVAAISGNAQHLLEDNGGKLKSLVRTLRPTASLLDRYSPMFPCLFASTNQIRRDLERLMGFEYPGIHTFTSFLPSQEGYLYPRDLPRVGVEVGPTCFGGPIEPRKDVPVPHVIFDDGWLGFVRSDAVVPGGSPDPSPLLPSSPPSGLGAAAPAGPEDLLGRLGDAAVKGLPR